MRQCEEGEARGCAAIFYFYCKDFVLCVYKGTRAAACRTLPLKKKKILF
jgi:hypothetical protein